MDVSRELVIECYEFLRKISPTLAELPPAEAVEFRINQDPIVFGTHTKYVVPRTGSHRLVISAARHSHLMTLLQTVAHEMCHMKVWPNQRHGPIFHAPRDEVCADFGWDAKAF